MNGSSMRVAVGVAAVFVLFTGGMAQAQSWTSPDPAAKPWVDSKVNVGPVYFNPTFNLSNVGIDNNVFDDPTYPRRDFTATLAMTSLMGVHFGDTLVLSVNQDTRYIYYRRYRSERAVDGALGAVLELRTPVFRPYIKVDSTHTHARQGYEIDARAGRQIPTFEVGADVYFGRLSLGEAYHRVQTTYAAGEVVNGVDLGTALDNTTRQYRSIVRWQATDLATFVGGADVIQDRFPNNPLNDSNSTYYYGGLETHGDALIVGSIYLGYKVQKHLDLSVASFKGFSAQSDVTFIPTERTKLQITTDRGPQYSYEAQYAYYVQQGAGVTLTERLAAQFDATLSAKNEWLAYQALVPGTVAARTDQDDVLSAGMGYFVGGQNGSRYGMTVERAERRSPVAGVGYHTWRVYSNVRLTF